MTIKECIEKIILVNDRWLKEKPQELAPGWSVACYFMGCVEAYKVTGKKEYLEAAIAWGEKNGWKTDRYGDAEYAVNTLVPFFTYPERCDWQFDNPLDYQYIHADFLACGRTYLELKKLVPEVVNMDILYEVMGFTVEDEHDDYWFWVDAIHMALCLYHMVAKETGDDRFAEQGHKFYLNNKDERGCYDVKEHLWYRDARFFPDKMRTENGKKVFWSRGNGWVYAGLIQTLSVLEKESPYYEGYKETFLEMTEAILKSQGKDGFWRSSLLDPEEYPMWETSGTLLFLHSILRAVRLGILDESYLPAFEKGFEAVNREAVFEDGTVGWVQGVAASPGVTEARTSVHYAVGYYLMTCSEWIAYCEEHGKV